MLKRVSLCALTAAAIVAAVPTSPASAAGVMNSVGHVSVSRPMNNFGNNNIVSSNQNFATNPWHPNGPEYQKKWVCGPIVNWDGSPHCHWVDIQRTY